MINLYEILQEVINESVSSDNVNDAIDNKYQVIINYSDDKNRAPGKRIIEPYVYGLSKAGNEVFRAFQYNGDTYRGVPKWKLFRLDRVKSWQPTDRHFNMPPNKNGWATEAYNENGDNSMSLILHQIDFNDTNDNYSPDDRLNILRKQTDNIRKSKPIKLSNLDNKKEIAINPDIKSVMNDRFNSDDFQKMLQRNLETTRKEKAKRGFSLSNQDDDNPIINNTINDVVSDNEYEEPVINSTIDSETNGNSKYSSDDFQKMLQRNLETTRKEKAKRGFSLQK